ncbi:glycosyltransferase family 2 protein [Microbacterium marinilacus]|uniref:Glycosyltransferase family 2 protein n=1 Tax=Microbacterium marinilacus TaxID=415209 RepID=A0ABP7BBI0_9MICO|nr:glycosyltransferase [Microbacterium marinilacus]MBY0690187.1 glycosyltransferase [Microbacterium marinilacus]
MTTPDAPRRHLIAIATYRRPDDLVRLLDSLRGSVDAAADIVVVDNDADESARAAVEAHPLAPAYVVETEPGIASARNRGLESFTDAHAAVIFVDDDEWVEPAWYETLTAYARESGAGVVQGPVITVLPDATPEWIPRGGFYQRRVEQTGTELPSAATNNTLLTREAWVRAGSPRFDTAFSSTGGSDWDLFWGVRKAGARILYCAEAVVSEDVPSSRLSWQWLRQRYLRNGIVEARVRRKHGDPLALFVLRAVATLGVGATQTALDAVLRRGRHARSLRRVYIPLGKLSGLLGHRIHEYKRVG